MERFKEIRKKMLRQMAFSIVTMAAVPASQPSRPVQELAWTMPGSTQTAISADLMRGHSHTDCDKQPGQAS